LCTFSRSSLLSKQYSTTIRKKKSIRRRKEAIPLPDEEDSFNTQSINYQKKMILRELQHPGSETSENAPDVVEFWPKRHVALDLEFPYVAQEKIEALRKEGAIQDDNPIHAALELQRRKGERTEVKRLEGMKRKELARPEWHRQTVTIDALEVERKLELPPSLRLQNAKIGSSAQRNNADKSAEDGESASGLADIGEEYDGQGLDDDVLEQNAKASEKNSRVKVMPSFQSLGVSYPSLLQTLATNWNITTPTEIQVLAIPEALKGSHLFIADQTGMGKSLAYILPLLMRLKELEARPAFRRRGQRSRAIILVPTRELVEQLVRIVKACMEGTPEFSHMRVLGMAGGLSTDKKEQMAFTPGLDVLVTTGDRLSFHVDKLHFNLDDTKIFVVDEADTIFSIDTLKIQLLNFVYKLETVCYFI
jgi:hypothetical protein